MFEPVLSKAFALIDEQVAGLKKEAKATFKVLCLCGGLGQSEYVWSKFQEYCNEKLNGHCQLVTDDRAWSAVVRGAAVRGLDGSMVIAKRAKRCYGIGVHQEFREGVDREEDSFECPIKGKRADGYIDWVVRRYVIRCLRRVSMLTYDQGVGGSRLASRLSPSCMCRLKQTTKTQKWCFSGTCIVAPTTKLQ